MSTVAEPGVRKVCRGCDEPFEDVSSNRARSYCYTCRPPRDLVSGAQIERPVPKSRTRGTPFTVDHFKRWSRRFKMKDGRYFKVEPYEELFLTDLFARTGGRPTYAELWLVVPEGNGKTTFVALVVLYTIEFRPEAWVPVAASARDQAVDLTYRIASGFVIRNGLEDRYKLHPGYRSIIHRGSLGAAKIFASDAASGDGVDPDLAVIEELHRLATMELYETWAGKLDKSDGQLVIVSTAGEVGGAFEKMRTQLRQAATEIHTEGCFTRAAHAGVVMHEYALPEGADPENLALVAAANPFSRKTLRSIEAKRAKPSWNLAHWLRFTCNRPTRVANAAITEREWHDAATAEPVPSGEVWVGIDVGWRWDTTALVPLRWVDDEHRRLGPATIIEPPRDTSSTDPDILKAAFMQLVTTYDELTTVVMDTNRAEDIAGWLSDELGLLVIDRVQTNGPQSEDYERFMLALRQGHLRHSGDPGLRQHALNAVVKVLPDGSAKFTRPSEVRNVGHQQEVRVIDALTAAAMVHSVKAEPPEAEPDYAVAGFK